MKFVFAPDSFKESLSALAIAEILDKQARRHFDGIETELVPIADGGEGTAEAITAAMGGTLRTACAFDPLGRERDARFGVFDGGRSAVIELAEASGLHLISPAERDVMRASSYGTGQLIREALSLGANRLLIGLGGSATNDGGMGMLCALGAKFFDGSDAELAPCGGALGRVARADLSGIDRRYLSAEIEVICDVTNTLLGDDGATYIYGPQKGASGETLVSLEEGMHTFARVMREASGVDAASVSGAGAAGGVGAALYYTAKPSMLRGIDAVLDAVCFDQKLEGASLAVTGEGRFDRQSVRFLKAPVGVAKRCQERGIPVIVLAGSVGDGAEALYDIAGSSVQTVVPGPVTLEDAIQNAHQYATEAADRLFRTLKIGAGL